MIKQPYIAYYRVSTEEQGKSGLGLAAQKEAVTNFVDGEGVLMGEFTDVESGASDTRQGMMNAIEACKTYSAVLVVKELSRITRGGFGFRALLDEFSIDFIEAGSPHDPEVVKDIKFALAKEERSKIRKRTKDALAQIKGKLANGEIHISKAGNVVMGLGNPNNLTQKARDRSIEIRRRRANENPNNKMAGAFTLTLRGDGMTYKQIAERLNEGGFKTSRGKEFSQMQVKRLIERYS